MNLEQRRISPRMGLPKFTIRKGDAPNEIGYHNQEGGLLPPSKTSVEEAQETPAQEKEEQHQAGRKAEGLRQSRRQRYVVRALDGLPMEGHSSGVVWGFRKRRPRAFPEVEAQGPLREAFEVDGRALR